MIFIKRFVMEFQKYSARTVPTVRALSSLKVNKLLCEDLLFSVGEPVNNRESFAFSSAYFLDFNKVTQKVDWGNLYVLDGVKYLHKISGTSLPLVKNRDLFYFLYANNDSNAAFCKALLTNPWLNDICNQPAQFMSEKVFCIKDAVSHFNSSTIMKVILGSVSEDFTPRGVWGLDYMFLWKKFNEEAEITLSESLSLIHIDAYVNSFQEKVSVK